MYELEAVLSKFKDSSLIDKELLASQIELSTLGLQVLKDNGLVYLAMEERTGKTLTSILIAEECINCTNVLVVTKKKALTGWNNTLDNYLHLAGYTVTTWQHLDKVNGQYGLVILDEPHSFLSGFPQAGVYYKQLLKICDGKPIIYISATPYAQGLQQVFHQLALSDWSPWAEYKNAYDWYKDYAERDKAGKFFVTYIGSNQTVVDYKRINQAKAKASIDHLFITKTRQNLGFEHEPEDKLHYVVPSEKTKLVYNTIVEDRLLAFNHGKNDKEYVLSCDTPTKLRVSLHMIEGGTIKIENEYLTLALNDKIDYIMKHWGDTQDIVIMYHYIEEGNKLRAWFKHARILQGTSYAEGVDLSMHKHLIIYSQDFSTSKHTQRRARQANKLRKDPIVVHFLLVKNAVSEQVYKTVSINKKNFVDSLFENERI